MHGGILICDVLFVTAAIFTPVIDMFLANSFKYREGDDSRISDFLMFCPNNLYSELFSKIPFKGPEAL